MAKQHEPTEQVRLPKSFVRRLRRLAAHFERDPKDMLVECLDPYFKGLEARMGKEFIAEITPPAKPKNSHKGE